MATTKAKRHTHKYYRVSLGFSKVWACALPDCNHYMPQNMEALVNGKASLCWNCQERFILNPQNMENEKPICDDCENERIVLEQARHSATH